MSYRFKIMDHSGDDEKEFTDRAMARASFDTLTKNMLAYRHDGRGKHVQLTRFEQIKPDSETLFSPKLQGG